MKSYIQDPPEKLENTIKKYNTTLTHMQAFKKSLHFSDIDSTLLKEFYKYMNVTLNLSPGVVSAIGRAELVF